MVSCYCFCKIFFLQYVKFKNVFFFMRNNFYITVKFGIFPNQEWTAYFIDRRNSFPTRTLSLFYLIKPPISVFYPLMVGYFSLYQSSSSDWLIFYHLWVRFIIKFHFWYLSDILLSWGSCCFLAIFSCFCQFPFRGACAHSFNSYYSFCVFKKMVFCCAFALKYKLTACVFLLTHETCRSSRLQSLLILKVHDLRYTT